jgi:hypothetical protein
MLPCQYQNTSYFEDMMCRCNLLPWWVGDLKAQRLRQDFETIGLAPHWGLPYKEVTAT